MDYCGHSVSFFMKHIIKLLKDGLNYRIKLIQQQPLFFDDVTWDLNDEPFCSNKSIPFMKIGLILDPENMLENIEKGPSADTDEAKEFRKFWGEKSELRRFQDGMILEAVHWGAKSLADRRGIVARAVKFMLLKHFNIKKKFVRITGPELDFTLHSDNLDVDAYGTGEEAFFGVVENFDTFVRKLRQLKGLRYSFASIQAVSPVFRGTEVFPPKKLEYVKKCSQTQSQCYTFGKKDAHCKWIKPLKGEV